MLMINLKNVIVCFEVLIEFWLFFLFFLDFLKIIGFWYLVFFCILKDFGGENKVEVWLMNKMRLKIFFIELLLILCIKVWKIDILWFKFCFVL